MLRLICAVLTYISFTASIASADIYEGKNPFQEKIMEREKQLCNPAREYIKAMKNFRSLKEFAYTDKAAREIAGRVAKGCDGAADRFATVYLMLKKIGTSERRSLEMALELSAVEPQVQKNFVEIFNKAFLAEFFDYDFPKAMKLAFALSTGFSGDPQKARQDFIELVKLCKSTKQMDLPLAFCADYVVKIAHLSQFYPKGVRQPFLDLYTKLRENREISLDIKNALKLSYDILKSGPNAPASFFEAFDFAMSKTGLDLNKKASLQFAADLSQHSYRGEEPPILSFPDLEKTTRTE
jgi:hypothetical protein